jgi:putative ABC transport system permease protein
MFVIFKTMYVLPDYEMHYDPVYGISSIMLFVVVIAAAVLYACYKEQKEVPAVLMRPKAPRTGSRVLLEKIPFIWNRFSFLNKVTARNLFRYKKRLFMTVIGIMGCTGLLICGFSVRDTVTELRPRQYDKVSQYDFMAVTADDNDKLLSYVDDNENIADFINIQYESVKVICGKNEQTLQMIVIPEGQSIEKYVSLKDKKGNDIFLDNEGIIVTYNAASVLGFDKGDTVTVQKTNLTQEELPVSGIVENYLGNMIYMTQPVYEKYFGEFAPNGIYANFTEKCSDEVEFTKDFARQDGVLTAVSKQELQNDFSNAFMILNLVVYIVIVLAAALALVVLFTLSTTNISERERELATIKVLGFYDREVHLYVNKETLILTIIGILCGMPMGWFFGMWIGYSLNMPSINYEVVIHPASYIISGLIAFCFALAVNVITNRILNRINPVEALKSVE